MKNIRQQVGRARSYCDPTETFRPLSWVFDFSCAGVSTPDGQKQKMSVPAHGEQEFHSKLCKTRNRHRKTNKKQCSRQLQCNVPCSVGNFVNSSLFINSSLSSLSSTSHAIQGRGGGPWEGGRGHFGPAVKYCTTTWCFALNSHNKSVDVS